MLRPPRGKIVFESEQNTEPAAIGQFLLAETYEREGEGEKARDEYAKVKEQHSGVNNWAILSDYSIAVNYMKAWYEKGDSLNYQKAVESFNKFISDYPTDKRAYKACFNLAGIYYREKQWRKSLTKLAKVIDYNAEKMTNVAPGYTEKEKKEYEQTLEKSYMMKGEILSTNLKKYKEAVEAYNQTLVLNSDNDQAMYGKAVSLTKIGMKPEAKEIFEELIEKESPLSGMAENFLKRM